MVIDLKTCDNSVRLEVKECKQSSSCTRLEDQDGGDGDGDGNGVGDGDADGMTRTVSPKN